MSHTTLFGMPKAGTVEPVAEYSNSWTTAPCIWTPLCRWLSHRTLPSGKVETDADVFARLLASFGMSDGSLGDLFALVEDPRVPAIERLVLLSTCDGAVIEASAFGLMADAYEEFAESHPTGVRSSLDGMTVDLRRMDEDQRWAGACFWWTNLSPNPWVERAGGDGDRDRELATVEVVDGEHCWWLMKEFDKINKAFDDED